MVILGGSTNIALHIRYIFIRMASQKKRGLLDILKELAETSALHGIPKIASSRQLAVKILWCILVLTAIGVMAYQLLELFKTFYSNPVQTTVSLDFSTLQFPAITVCNMNPVRKTKFRQSPALVNTLFPNWKGGSTGLSKLKRRKRNVSQPKKRSIISDSVAPLFETSVFETSHGLTKDGIIEMLLAQYNVNTIEELLAKLGKDDITIYFNSTLPETDRSSVLDLLLKYFPEIFTEDFKNANYTVSFNTTLTNGTLSTFNTSENISTEDPLNVSEHTTTKAQNNVSNITTPPEVSTEDPFWFGPTYEDLGWTIFRSTETDLAENFTTGKMEGVQPPAEHFNDPKDKWDLVITEFKTTFRSVNIDERRRMGHQLKDFIQYASFAKRQQNIPTYFKQFTTTDFGNCYTLDNSKYKSWRSGPESGIKLILHLEVDEYVESFSAGYGVRIVFHEPGTFPMPDEEGITISPGYETSIGLRAINVTRLGEPYGQCTVSGSERFRRKYNMTYSKTACLEFCRIENIISRCNCIPIDTPDIDFDTNVPVCKRKDEYCTFGVELMFEDGALHCDCINPCSEFVYVKTISGRVWPHREYLKNILMKDMCAKNLVSLDKACKQIHNGSEEFDYERYRNNFVRVLIYFEDLNFQQITEEPFYTTVRFICDIGGAMGLFIGVSILSLFEVLQLILEVILYLMDRKKNIPKTNGLVEKENAC